MSLVIFEPERRRMNIYGYCRISTAKQSIDRQIRNIKAEYPTAHIVQEAYTGTSIFRPEWLKLYRVLKSGDMVVFDSVSRMSRNAEEGFTLYEDLYHKGIRLPVRASLITRKRFLHPVHILVWFVPPVAGRRINTRPQSGHSTEIIAMRNYLPKLFNCRQVIRLSCHHKNLFKPLCLL